MASRDPRARSVPSAVHSHTRLPLNDVSSLAMSPSRLASALVALALALALAIGLIPPLAYLYGLAQVDGRPMPPAVRSLSAAERAGLWRSLGERGEPALPPLTTYGYVWRILTADTDFPPGTNAAARVATTYLRVHMRGGTHPQTRWHVAGMALTIWVTQNWTADELLAWAAERPPIPAAARPRAAENGSS